MSHRAIVIGHCKGECGAHAADLILRLCKAAGTLEFVNGFLRSPLFALEGHGKRSQ